MKLGFATLVATAWLGVIAAFIVPQIARAANPDWNAVEQALGRPGQMQSGEVFRIGMPRTDLNVTVKGVPVQGGLCARLVRRLQADR
jgi:hypothetical protein